MDKIPSIAEMRQSKEAADIVSANVDSLVAELQKDAAAIQSAVRPLLTTSPVGIYLHPDKYKFAVDENYFNVDATQQKCVIGAIQGSVKQAQDTLDLSDPLWVKVAYSKTLRRAGELLNFFPGEYIKHVRNSPGPLQSMLSSGVLGAGLGYGAGHLIEKYGPRDWQHDKLKRNLTLAGGAIGAIPGAALSGANLVMGKDLLDPSLLSADPVPNIYPDTNLLPESDAELVNMQVPGNLGDHVKKSYAEYVDQWREAEKAVYKEAEVGSGFSLQQGVNVNALGQVLWETGADPRDVAITLGSLNAAGRLPGGRDPGWVTPAQVGHLALRMGGGYLSGALVGAALGHLTGAPQSVQNTLKRTGAYMGVVNTVVPRLFGNQ